MNKLELEEAKRRVALEAVKLVKDGMVVGLGTGSTAAYFIEALGERVKGGLKIIGVPTSYQAYFKALESGVPVINLDEVEEVDLAVDGADEVDLALNLLKGGGAALTREKVVASMAKAFVVIVDETKVVRRLGETRPVAIEVLPFAHRYVSKKLKELGGEPKLRMAGGSKDGPVVTDNGNFIVDAKFPPIDRPAELEEEVKRISGVIEVGIFTRLAKKVLIGGLKGVEVLERR
ncbi:MAG: ribose-5-phosphate isomerase RpiA [Candidatus Nezhaarchaeota archaeon]|nr:ribose-5-phosphate isomerase RpiA [Candidatus Nezhaarchaeota archaeon]